GDGSFALPTGGVGVDLELVAGGNAVRSEAPGPDLLRIRKVPVRAVAAPSDDEVALRVHRHRRAVLGPGRVGVDLEGPAERRSVGGESAPLDAGAARVRTGRILARPDGHAARLGVGGDGGQELVVGRGRIPLA